MSARQWKIRLEECQSRLTESVTSAREWRLVAENRLEVIHRIDETLLKQLRALEKVGEIFGTKLDLNQVAWTDTKEMGAGQTAVYTMGKIEAVSLYLRDLMAEASSIQITLSDTYTLACQAMEVSRPSDDISIPHDLKYTDISSSPLEELVGSLNDLPPPQQKQSQSTDGDCRYDSAVDVVDGPRGALALYSKM